jgi:hypothetical protein
MEVSADHLAEKGGGFTKDASTRFTSGSTIRPLVTIYGWEYKARLAEVHFVYAWMVVTLDLTGCLGSTSMGPGVVSGGLNLPTSSMYYVV